MSKSGMTENYYEHNSVAQDAWAKWFQETGLGRLDPIVNATGRLLATVRGEEREAAFKVLCSECAEGDVPNLDQQARWFYHKWGDKQVGCSASKLRLEA